jgi:hypothetical protein
MKDYGKVNYKGVEITLTEDAHWEYMSNSTEPDNWMVANGIDKDGNEYRVEFKLKEEYEDQREEIDDLEVLFDFENPTEVYSHKDNKYI